MAAITGQTNERIYGIPKWGGLNEAPDGETRLKLGEASRMVNWKITRDGNLKRRPGSEFIAGVAENYQLSMNYSMKTLFTAGADDTVEVFPVISVDANPGDVVLGTSVLAMRRGVLTGLKGTVSGGVFTVDENEDIEISNGVLGAANEETGESVTMAELQERLAGLPEGSFLYLQHEEGIYAINASCLTEENGVYTLSGYRVKAIPAGGEDTPVTGMWTGFVGGKEVFLVAGNGNIWSIYDEEDDAFRRRFIGYANTDRGVSFFPFDGKVYILNGYEYYVWDGETFEIVDGYRPLIATVISPDIGGGSESGELTGEYINRLNGKRRVWLSPDGTHSAFRMPEGSLLSIDWVKDLSTGEASSLTWQENLTDGIITFDTVPSRGVNSLEVGYTVTNTLREQVTGNLFFELYGGTTDTTVFLYGDGTNRTIYSGMDYDGLPRADYFPDQYEVHVGDSNTPITSMIRHYGMLMAFKPTECWALQHGVVSLANDSLTPAIYCTPVSRDKGNLAPGQVRLVNNSPVTCSQTELYQWTNSSYYTSNLTRDERQAQRISDRVQTSVKEVTLPDACMWDDNDNQEFYIAHDGIALVWNYAVDAWYRYEGFDVARMCSFHGEVYLGMTDGRIRRLTYDKMTDGGTPIKAEWESGAIDFGAGYMRKYSSMLWVGLKPEAGTSVNICLQTDRKDTFKEKIVSSEKAKISGEPFMVKTKLKAKKFVYYTMMLSVDDVQPAVTVTDVQIRVRQTGYAK